MAKRYTHNYTYRIGPMIPRHKINNDIARRERERQQTQPGGKPIAAPAETRAETSKVEQKQPQT